MNIAKQDFPQTGLLRLPQVLELIPVSRSGWYRGVQEGRYPKGVKIGLRAVGWYAKDIHALMQSFNHCSTGG